MRVSEKSTTLIPSRSTHSEANRRLLIQQLSTVEDGLASQTAFSPPFLHTDVIGWHEGYAMAPVHVLDFAIKGILWYFKISRFGLRFSLIPTFIQTSQMCLCFFLCLQPLVRMCQSKDSQVATYVSSSLCTRQTVITHLLNLVSY